MQKLTNFIKYNNAFTIAIAAFLLIAGSSFASETVRDTVIGKNDRRNPRRGQYRPFGDEL